MRKILILLFFLPSISFSFDESYFDGPIDQCICAVIPDQCNKYCMCDPHCTDEQKEQFDYHLPETFSNNKIGCDPKNRIDKTNLDSINKEIINGVNCYSIKGKENGKKITNYNAKDFGIESFSDAVSTPFDPKNKYTYEHFYHIGDKLIGNGTQFPDTETKNFYLPIAIGSSTSNALLPILAGYSYPKYSSRINSSEPLTFLSEIAYIGSVFDKTGEEEWLSFPLYKNFNREADEAGKFLNFLYIFPFDPNGDDNDIYYTNKTDEISIKATADIKGYEIIGNPPDDYMSFSFEVYFGYRANYFDNEYQDVSMGYYYGVPIMAELGDPKKISDLFTNRSNLQVVNGVDVLFGVRSTVVAENNNNGNLYAQMKLKYAKLYKSFGNIYIFNESQELSKFFVDTECDGCYINETTKNPNSKTAVAEWNFHYTVNKNKPIMILESFHAILRSPKDESKVENIIYEINFINDDDNEDDKENPGKFLSLNYSAIFDVFFRDESETLETTGVFFCFALIGTIWCWYSCFFYIED